MERAAGAGSDVGLHEHLPRLGELHRIADEVHDDLAEPGHVTHHHVRHGIVDEVGQIEPLLGRPAGEQVERRLHAFPEIEGLLLQLEPAGLDLGVVEDVVDDPQQGVAAGAHGLDEVALLVVQLRVEEQARQPDHRVHRRADLVAHIGEELALGPGAGFGAIPRLPQLREELLHLLHHRVERPGQRTEFIAERGLEPDGEVAGANTSRSGLEPDDRSHDEEPGEDETDGEDRERRRGDESENPAHLLLLALASCHKGGDEAVRGIPQPWEPAFDVL